MLQKWKGVARESIQRKRWRKKREQEGKHCQSWRVELLRGVSTSPKKQSITIWVYMAQDCG